MSPRARLEEISKANSDLPAGQRYPIIYADPPWRYKHPPMGGNRVVENHYPTMTLEGICALKVRIEQGKAEADETRMADLRNHTPDLAELVTEGRMSLSEAHAALGERKKRLHETIEDGKRALVWRGSVFLAAARLCRGLCGCELRTGAQHRLRIAPRVRWPALDVGELARRLADGGLLAGAGHDLEPWRPGGEGVALRLDPPGIGDKPVDLTAERDEPRP
jgi:hypothetical protein